MNYSVRTKLSTADAIKAAIEYFGPDGMGLSVVQSTPDSARFEAAGGFVTVEATGDDPTELQILTREYDYDARRFIEKVS